MIDIEKLAATGAEMPDGLRLTEQLLFLTLRELYSNYRAGAVNRERASREKQRILASYKVVKQQQDAIDQQMQIRQRLSREIGSLHKCGCPECQKVGRIFDGIDREDPPEDIKKLQELNSKLRDLVQKRTERATELATKLDRLRWAADGGIDKVMEVLNEEN